MASKFVIVGANDNPLYEADFAAAPRETPHFGEFVVNAALDLVDEAKWRSKDMYLRKVDSFGRYHLLAWVTATNAVFMLLTERPEVEPARAFFSDVYELFLKALLNPFYSPASPITSPLFDAKVRKLAQRYLSV